MVIFSFAVSEYFVGVDILCGAAASQESKEHTDICVQKTSLGKQFFCEIRENVYIF